MLVRSGADVRRRLPTLAEAFDPRRNALTVMRLALAGLVAVTHALLIARGWEPVLGRTDLSDFAVDAFFVISGFLVTRSLIRLSSTGRYAWHRFLRLMPGFWVCLVLTAVAFAPLAAGLSGQPPTSVLTAEEAPAWAYPLVNAGLPMLQYPIGELRTPLGETALDGSLWTLQYEAACYVLLAGAGLVGALRRPVAVLVMCAIAWLALTAETLSLIPWDVPLLSNREMFRFVLVFLLGAAAHLYAHRIRLGRGLLVVAAVVTVAAAHLGQYQVGGAVAFAYVCLYGMVRLPSRWQPRWDLSYGVYIYHWPVQFVLSLTGVVTLRAWAFVGITVALTAGIAAASWRWVESPSLTLKDIRRRPPVYGDSP